MSRRTGTPSNRHLAPMLRRSLPAVMGVIVVGVLGAAALQIGQSNLRAAQDDRMRSREGLVSGYQANVANGLDPRQRLAMVLNPRLSPDAGPGNDALLAQIMADRDGGVVFAAVLTADGRPLQSSPAGLSFDPALLGPTWTAALEGRPGVADAFRRGDELVTATVWPLGQGRPWGALVMGEARARTSQQHLLEQLGSQNGQPGGLFVTDRNGVVIEAARRELIGERTLSAEEMGPLTADRARAFASPRADGETMVVATRFEGGFTMGFEQRTDALMGDLRDAQHQRDLSLIAVLGVSLAGLVSFQIAREVAARRAEARIGALLRNGQDMIAVVDGNGVVSFLSAAIENLLGHREDAWGRRPLAELCHPDDVLRLAALLAEPATSPLLNLRLRTSAGDYRWFDVEASDLRAHPEVGGILLTCHAIGDRKRLQDELRYQATHDRLTGLPNRAEFNDRIQGLVVGGRPVRPFALLYLDLDHFKPVNDVLGHDAGDSVLVSVSERMRAAVGANGFVSRLGGDEFAILLDGAGRPEAVAVADKLLEAARAPIAVGATLAHLDASIGISLADPSMHLDNVEQLVRRADEAMYRAKKGGRGRFDFASAPRSATRPPAAVSERRAPAPPTGPPADVSSTEPVAGADGGAYVRPPRRRLRAAAPMLVAASIVVAIAAAGLAQSTVAQHNAEAERTADLVSAIGRSAVYYSSIYDPTKTAGIASDGPWALDGSALDQIVTTAWSTNPQLGPQATAFLVALDGTVLASAPPGASASAGLNSDAWKAARAGKAGYLPWIADPDQPRSYLYYPISRNGTTVAVLVVGVSVRHGAGQEELQRSGGAGYEDGGASLLDSDGVIYSSWNPDLIGQRVADPAQLVGLTPGSSRNLSTAGSAMGVAPVTATSVPTYIFMSVPTASFFGDLRKGEMARTLSMLALVVTAVIGLAWVNHRRERAVRRSEARLDSLLQNAHDVVVVLREDGTATFVSSAVHRLLGYQPDDRVGQDLLDLVHPGDRPQATRVLAEAHARGTASAHDVRLRDVRGDYQWFDLDAVDLRHHKEVGGVLLTCHEVTDRKALQDQLAYQATRDPLTGLPNRATLASRLEALVDGPDATPFAILFIDLDHFKPVNDTLGHDAGDEVLKVIAGRFRQSVRGDNDTDPGDLVCRLGGDEFAVVLLNTTEGIAQATAARLVQVARQPITVGDHTIEVGATIGVSVSHPSREDPEQAMRKADHAMYAAKESGRNTFALAPSDL
jgi:diguanylate cyclase (GGDEF)-like protein/PAS domain S-box-containing protein